MYVYQLAKELIANGHECAILCISDEKKSAQYNGINLFYIPSIQNISREQSNPKNFNELLSVIQYYKPDIYHQHTYTPSLGVNHLVKLYNLGIRTVFTAHITSFSCIRGDLMLYGKSICDGKLDRNRCMDCYLQHRGISKSITRNILIDATKSSLLKLIFPALQVYDSKLNAITLFKNKLHHLVVVSKWQEKLLLLNGFDSSKISVCRQAINEYDIINFKGKVDSKILRIGFVGRIVKVKGLHLILEMLKKAVSSTFSLSVVGIKSSTESDYYLEMKNLAKSINTNWLEDLEPNEVIDFLDTIDLLVVPSTWLETGPYVIYEAMARKVPVLAFNKGGAVELIENNRNGWLVDTEEEFGSVLLSLIENRGKVFEMSSAITRVRTTNLLYEEMIDIYKKIV